MRWLITGASGLLGAHVLVAASTNGETVGWSRQRAVRGGHIVDVTDRADVFSQMRDGNFDVCVHCAANPNVASCEANPDVAYRLNVEGAGNVADACNEFGVRLVHVSTDMVFDGTLDRRYTEDDAVNPLQVYGKTKAASEVEALRAPGALIARVPLLYGRKSAKYRSTWLEECLHALGSGETVVADDLQVRQPAVAADIAQALIALGSSDVAGIVHVAPDEVLTKYAWSLRIAKAAGYATDRVQPSHEPLPGPLRPERSLLATDRLRSTGILLPRDASDATDEEVRRSLQS